MFWPGDCSLYDDDQVDEEGVRCKRCGMNFLAWEEGRSRPGNRKIWALVDVRGDVHDCRAVDPNTEFEEIE